MTVSGVHIGQLWHPKGTHYMNPWRVCGIDERGTVPIVTLQGPGRARGLKRLLAVDLLKKWEKLR
jgi:hypothetical protein